MIGKAADPQDANPLTSVWLQTMQLLRSTLDAGAVSEY